MAETITLLISLPILFALVVFLHKEIRCGGGPGALVRTRRWLISMRVTVDTIRLLLG